MMRLPRYAKWEWMADVVELAQQACANSGHDPAAHFELVPGAGKNSNPVGRFALPRRLARTKPGCPA
jgi:hypothetical protein